MKSPLTHAFTLVELIVVITILAILGTIGFVSLQGYSVNARDSVRIADTKTYLKALNIYQTKEGQVPLPDDMTTITGSGVVFSYQGTLSGSVITALKQGAVPLDPILEEPYLYATNEGRTKFQLLSYHERNTSSLGLTPDITFAAASYADMYPKVIGDNIGILIYQDQSPITDSTLDFITSGQNLKSYISNSNILSGSGQAFEPLLTYNSFERSLFTCKDIYNSNTNAEDGLYTIYSGDNFIDVLCKFDTDGGWTLIDGVSDYFGQIVIPQFGVTPNIDNYSMEATDFQALLRGAGNTIFKYEISRNTENLKVFIEIPNQKIGKSGDYNEAIANANFDSTTWIHYNGDNVAQNKVIGPYTRELVRSNPEMAGYGHIKAYDPVYGVHGWWISKTAHHFGELYFNESLLEIPLSSLPSFGGLFEYDTTHNEFSAFMVPTGTKAFETDNGRVWNNFPQLSNQGLEAGLWIQ